MHTFGDAACGHGAWTCSHHPFQLTSGQFLLAQQIPPLTWVHWTNQVAPEDTPSDVYVIRTDTLRTF